MLISYVDPQTLPGNVLRLRGSLEAALTRSSPSRLLRQLGPQNDESRGITH
jgi:hypothetical protein